MIVINLNNLHLKLQESAGEVLSVELRMRIIGEMSQQVVDKLIDIATAEHQERLKKDSKAKRKSDECHDCNLQFLEEAIIFVFQDKLDADSRNKIAEFRPLRNKLIHAAFVDLLKKQGKTPTGRQILSMKGDRNELTRKDMRESVLSVDRNRGLEDIRVLASEVRCILDRILHSLS